MLWLDALSAKQAFGLLLQRVECFGQRWNKQHRPLMHRVTGRPTFDVGRGSGLQNYLAGRCCKVGMLRPLSNAWSSVSEVSPTLILSPSWRSHAMTLALRVSTTVLIASGLVIGTLAGDRVLVQTARVEGPRSSAYF
jgi:hypothetical protein